MSDQYYMDADYEVISMVNRGRGAGGELPAKVVHFIPEENAKTVLALDARIRKAKAAWKKNYDQPRQHTKKQRHYFANKGPPSQGYGFS